MVPFAHRVLIFHQFVDVVAIFFLLADFLYRVLERTADFKGISGLTPPSARFRPS